MQKKSRFLTGLLSAVMALTLFALPATAAGDTETGGTPTASVSDNWKQETGKIVIHKYEYNGANAGKDPTGEATDETKVPNDAKKLEGAGFTVYKVMTRDELAKYYDGYSAENQVKIDTYVENGKIKSAYEGDKVGSEIKTGSDGIATFEGLPLGLYVVVETTTPDKVTTAVDPFLVSIPMTKATTNKEWMYDVNVYPKNKTTYGGISLVKTGRKGETDDGPLNGVTFILEKKIDNVWTKINTPDNSTTPFDLTTGEDGKITVAGLSQGQYRFIESSIAGDNSYIIDENPINFTIGADGKATYNSETLTTAIPVVNDRPDLNKKVINKAGDPGYIADYSVGDLVPYKITVTVPQNITRLKTFTVVDTPSGLDDKLDTSFTVKYGDTAVAVDTYSVVKEGDHGFKVKFNPEKMTAYEGKDIVISYKAELLTTANKTKTGNSNTAKLEYTNDIKVAEDGTTSEGSTKEIHDSAFVYSFKLKVVKTADNKTTVLPNVKFDLYKEDTSGTVTGATAKALGLKEDKTWKKINGTDEPLKTDDNGEISVEGLANGEYYLVEVETVKGYNLLKGPVEVELKITYTTNWTTKEEYDDQGNLIKHSTTKKDTGFTNNKGEDSEIYIINVINRKGFDLPVTGGFGTLLFSGIGALLVVGGVGVLMGTKKKKDNA